MLMSFILVTLIQTPIAQANEDNDAICRQKYENFEAQYGNQVRGCAHGPTPDKLLLVVDKAKMTASSPNKKDERFQRAAMVYQFNHSGGSREKVYKFNKISTGAMKCPKENRGPDGECLQWEDHDTAQGYDGSKYAYTGRELKNCSSLYSNTPMPYTVRIGGAYAFHSVFNQNHVTGQPASAGCVRLKMEDARNLYCTVARMEHKLKQQGYTDPVERAKALRDRIDIKIFDDARQHRKYSNYLDLSDAHSSETVSGSQRRQGGFFGFGQSQRQRSNRSSGPFRGLFGGH